MQVCRGGDEISFTKRDRVPSSAHLLLEQTDNFSSDTVFQPEDGRIRPKHVVGELLYLQI